MDAEIPAVLAMIATITVATISAKWLVVGDAGVAVGALVDVAAAITSVKGIVGTDAAVGLGFIPLFITMMTFTTTEGADTKGDMLDADATAVPPLV